MVFARSVMAVAGLLLASSAIAADRAPILVELFTSEGCSSCPPAHTLAGELNQRDDVLVLSYHVNYWDYIGWTDRYATEQTTQRQHDYARSLRQRSVYTPEMVIGGVTHQVGSDVRAVSHAINAVAARRVEPPPIEAWLPHRSTVRVVIGAGAVDGEADVLLVRFLPKGESAVDAGENAGRTLPSYNVVRDFRRVGGWDGSEVTIDLSAAEVGVDGTDGCAVVVQEAGPGAVLAVHEFDMDDLRQRAVQDRDAG